MDHPLDQPNEEARIYSIAEVMAESREKYPDGVPPETCKDCGDPLGFEHRCDAW